MYVSPSVDVPDGRVGFPRESPAYHHVRVVPGHVKLHRDRRVLVDVVHNKRGQVVSTTQELPPIIKHVYQRAKKRKRKKEGGGEAAGGVFSLTFFRL